MQTQLRETLDRQETELAQIVGVDIQPPSRELALEDPDQFNAQMADYMANMQYQNQAREKLGQIQAETQRQQADEIAAFTAQRDAALASMIPEFADPQKGRQLASELVAYAGGLGIDLQRIQLSSAEELSILHKAMQFDRATTAAKKSGKPTKRPPKAARPGQSKTESRKTSRNRADLMKRHRQSGNIDTMAAIFESLL